MEEKAWMNDKIPRFSYLERYAMGYGGFVRNLWYLQ